MILEIDNIIRGIKDIRRQILVLQGNSPEHKVRMSELDDSAAEMEFKTRALEFELNSE